MNQNIKALIITAQESIPKQDNEEKRKKELYQAYSSSWESSLRWIQTKIEKAIQTKNTTILQKLERLIAWSYFFNRIQEKETKELKRNITLSQEKKEILQKDLQYCLSSSLSNNAKKDFLIDYYEKDFFRINDNDIKNIRTYIRKFENEKGNQQLCKIRQY